MDNSEYNNTLLENIFDNTKNTVATCTVPDANTDAYFTSLNYIFTPLVYAVTCFIENYDHDFIKTWEQVLSFIDSANDENKEARNIVAFGIRKDGCDGNTFLFSRINDATDKHNLIHNYYRRIYAVEIVRTKDPKTDEYVTILTLKDIQNSILPSLPSDKTDA